MVVLLKALQKGKGYIYHWLAYSEVLIISTDNRNSEMRSDVSH